MHELYIQHTHLTQQQMQHITGELLGLIICKYSHRYSHSSNKEKSQNLLGTFAFSPNIYFPKILEFPNKTQQGLRLDLDLTRYQILQLKVRDIIINSLNIKLIQDQIMSYIHIHFISKV